MLFNARLVLLVAASMATVTSACAVSSDHEGNDEEGASEALTGASSACLDTFETNDLTLRNNVLGGVDIKPGQTLQRCFERGDIYDGFYFSASGSSSYALEVSEPGSGLASFVATSDVNRTVNFSLYQVLPTRIEQQALTAIAGKSPKLAQSSGVLAKGTYFLRLDIPRTGSESGSFGYKFKLTEASGAAANLSLASITATAAPRRRILVNVALTSPAPAGGVNVEIKLPLGTGFQDSWFVPALGPSALPRWTLGIPAGQTNGTLAIQFAPRSVTTSTPCMTFQASLRGASVFSQRSPSDQTCVTD